MCAHLALGLGGSASQPLVLRRSGTGKGQPGNAGIECSVERMHIAQLLIDVCSRIVYI